ncbi:uncharacterized protein LOC131060851 isoform X2 [Cryptomeria japonica]|uniref:uncharacterized protein LOC131060851 isoform X2 n=1 Tax=Cryptomeria japonica TaxID=3369 RepID=UPI0025ABAF04|nr:uncharacterized protein LOC131060851 isoform X2 [Cryptomeria japonica]
MEVGAAAAAEKKKKSKKRKGQGEVSIHNEQNGKRSQIEGEYEGPSTISIAVAGSIIDNCQSLELATRLAGQIARAATIFRIDEVIVFDDKENTGVTSDVSIWDDEGESGALFLARILHHLETPQYLRRALIPKHNILRYVGLLPPLDAPHHARKHEWVPYREGVTLDRKPPAGVGTFVDVGLLKPVYIQQTIEPGLRVTVAMGSNKSLGTDCVRQAVKHSEPREKKGLYWGYTVRYAYNISNVFNESPYKSGYDYSIGTSEHGDIIRSSDLVIPKFREKGFDNYLIAT